MATLTPDIAQAVVETCRTSADEIVAALTRAFDGQLIGVTVHEAASYEAEKPPAGFDGPGLALVFQCADASAVAVLPESSGLLPAWYREPDATGKSKLETLAQELSMLLLPSEHAADEYHAVPLDELAAMLARAELAADAAWLPITVKHAEKEGQLSLLWPLAKHTELLPPPEAKPQAAAAPAPRPADDPAAELARLPRYARSLLKVLVPVSVNLATQKHTVQEIRELVPGAIIKFDKSCEELLDVVVCDQAIAAGEVVKVGDKFGLRIRHMIQPQEQFIAIKTTLAI